MKNSCSLNGFFGRKPPMIIALNQLKFSLIAHIFLSLFAYLFLKLFAQHLTLNFLTLLLL